MNDPTPREFIVQQYEIGVTSYKVEAHSIAQAIKMVHEGQADMVDNSTEVIEPAEALGYESIRSVSVDGNEYWWDTIVTYLEKDAFDLVWEAVEAVYGGKRFSWSHTGRLNRDFGHKKREELLLHEDIGSDSLDDVEFVMALESVFDMDLPDDLCYEIIDLPLGEIAKKLLEYYKIHGT